MDANATSFFGSVCWDGERAWGRSRDGEGAWRGSPSAAQAAVSNGLSVLAP